MSAINEFPWIEIADEYAKETILPWVKRCLADAPKPDTTKLFTERNVVLGNEYQVWKAKWFTQFKEEK